MSDTKPLTFYTDRSAANLDDKCGMAFYHNRLAGGKGLVPKVEADAFRVGRIIHEDLSLIGNLADISEESIKGIVGEIMAGVDPSKVERRAMEDLYRRLGWIVGFALFIEPKIRAEYENVSIEQEIALDRSPLIVGVTPDRLLRHRKQGYLVYREYKSFAYGGQKWQDSWKYAIQLHTSLKAIEEEFGEAPRFAQVMGLSKGYYSNTEMRRLMHPYVYGYYNETTQTWSTQYRSGNSWIARPVWEHPLGLVEWVKSCGTDAALNMFPHTEPIFLNEEMLNSWVRRRQHRERLMYAVKEEVKTNYEVRQLWFEQRTDRCRPPVGDACPYLPLCWNAAHHTRPELHPDFVERVPHHDLELML